MSKEDSKAIYFISVASTLSGIHQQTIRTYEQKGLIKPFRTGGGTRRYSQEDFFQNFPNIVKDIEPEKIFLHADKKVMYEQVIELMTFLQSQGHGKIGLVFQEK